MSLGMCYTVGMITIEHIDDQTFNATVEWDMYLIEVEGTVWTEQEDNLWGDQVESVSTIAHFDAVTDMKVSSKMTGDEVEVLNLDFAELVVRQLKEAICEEVYSDPCQVDYSPHYHDMA